MCFFNDMLPYSQHQRRQDDGDESLSKQVRGLRLQLQVNGHQWFINNSNNKLFNMKNMLARAS